MKKNLLSAAVKGALGLTAAAIMVPSMPAFAQSDSQDAQMVEEVVVTGSRIKRASNFDDAAQVVVMDRQHIDATGSLMVADVLRSSALNSLGSFSETSGSSAQSNATIDLRGLGDSRTLVMVNGRRLPGSPNLGAASVNLNMIPMAAVERIETLADGASAVYGSDAVAGAVNLIMREKFDGFEINTRHGQRSNDDGIEESLSFITGVSNDRGNITIAAEWDRRDPIYDGDRDYTAAWQKDFNGDGVIDIYSESDGISYYGAAWEIYDPNTNYYDLQAATDCSSENGFVGVMSAEVGLGGGPGTTVCGYAYANVSANKAELNRVNTYMNASYELTDQVEFYTNVLFSKVDSFGRYAPPAAPWINPPADYATNPIDVDGLLASGDITPEYELTGYYRWTNIGPRDNFVSDQQYDFVAGFRGDINANVSYDAYAQRSRYTSKENGYYYLSYPGLDYVLNNGIDPFSPEGAAAMKATTTQDNYTALSKVYGQLQFAAGDWFSAGETQILVGSEAFTLDYSNQYDAASEAGLVGGSSGNSSAGDRDVYAVFAEAVIPVTEKLELNPAVRYDNYSDFGTAVSPTIAATFMATEDLSFRARAGKGFRAPALSDLYGPVTFSAETATSNAGVKRQWDTYYSSNENVDAETSTSFSVGGNWAFAEGWSVDVGYWSVEVEDAISTPSVQEIFWAMGAGIDLDPASGVSFTGTGTGPDTKFYSSPTNAGTLDVSGIDLRLNGVIDTSFGQFTTSSLVTHTLSYETDAYFLGPVTDRAGLNEYPDLKAQLLFGWNMDSHSVNLTVDYTGKHDQETIIVNRLPEASGTDLDSWTTLNLAYGFDAGTLGKIKIGARNLTNEDPVLDKDGLFSMAELYDNTGRVWYAEYKKDF
ncbi:TonB-dependent receptor plug domain-containing protein [Microbulbifer hainanensis]|uniref:TonB-dependent receptor plug domain-containing protein n=1 Tax=Microbulbifer hainanensis TaxID=2735675 RepID=UPI0018680B82|nr:TonB-dependent receptor [Microbulbifer hainanensis]